MRIVCVVIGTTRSIRKMKIKIHPSYEIDFFVETITDCVPSLRIEAGDSPCNNSVVVAIRVNRAMLVSLCAETIKLVSAGDKSDSSGRKGISVSSVSCMSCNR